MLARLWLEADVLHEHVLHEHDRMDGDSGFKVPYRRWLKATFAEASCRRRVATAGGYVAEVMIPRVVDLLVLRRTARRSQSFERPSGSLRPALACEEVDGNVASSINYRSFVLRIAGHQQAGQK